jgi:ubiquinone/menaquinone biosynthesis C-methylase UbiE
MTSNIMFVKELTQDELRNEYDSIANEYERKLWFDQHILGIARLRKQLMPKAQGKILDVACGTGLNFPLFPSGSNVTGIDFSPGMLEVARQNASQLGLSVNLALMDAQKLDFPNRRFDTVVSTLSTCTIPHPLATLREMRRVCRRDGQILLLEHGHSSIPWIAGFQDRYASQYYQKNSGCRWNQDPLDLIQEAGLKLRVGRRALLGIFYLIEAVPE